MTIISGVYAITNKVNKKVYVGSSVNIPSRFRGHKKTLENGTHYNAKLQRAFVKYGIESFDFTILELVDSPNKEKLIEAEQRWINLFDAVKNGYNILPNAYSHLGAKRSDETKAKLSQSLRTALNDPDTKKKMSESAKKRGLSDNFRNAKRGFTKEQREHLGHIRLQTYIVTNPDGQEFIVDDIHSFCRENNLNQASLNCVLHRQWRHLHGWRIRWIDEPPRDDGKPFVIKKTYTCISPDGQEYFTENLKEFCAIYGLKRSAMSAVASLDSPIKTHKGWNCIKKETHAK